MNSARYITLVASIFPTDVLTDSSTGWVWLQDMKEAVRRLRGKMAAIEVEKMETEYQIRREVCREFQEQITDIEDAHR